MQLLSTRNINLQKNALEAVLKGIAEDGGLFVPSCFPKISMETVLEYAELSYAKLAAKVLHLYFDELDEDALIQITQKAYGNFDDTAVAPLKKLNDSEYLLELWHGPTLAFKDMALQVLPGLLNAAKYYTSNKQKTLILVATSGDTGKAALEGFKDAPGIDIMVFYPNEGVSNLQKLQMVTQEGFNTHVAAVKGNFDDAQTGVKEIFADKALNAMLNQKGYALSSANSINFGRLAPQIAYYISAYATLLKQGGIKAGEPVNFVVPTGNFGNMLAAYYAKEMGLPVNKLICASNRNNVLTDFFLQGEYQSRREFYKTSSPSMDILVSSNLERLLFEVTGRDESRVNRWMSALKEKGVYEIDGDSHKKLMKDFYAGWSNEERTFRTIKDIFEKYRYVLDPHTAVAQAVYEDYLLKQNDPVKTVVVSTASPYKFCADVLNALGDLPKEQDDFSLIQHLSNVSGLNTPKSISELKHKKVRHTLIVDKMQMKQTVMDLIG